MATIKIRKLGQAGVNADKDPLDLADEELRSAQNAGPGTGSSIKKRNGFDALNSEIDGSVLGGTTVPLADEFTSFAVLYLGRGGEVV